MRNRVIQAPVEHGVQGAQAPCEKGRLGEITTPEGPKSQWYEEEAKVERLAGEIRIDWQEWSAISSQQGRSKEAVSLSRRSLSLKARIWNTHRT